MPDTFDVRAVQLIQLEMLKELDRVCQKHDIRYFLCAGTLLGAVRHGGFIPWDDDLDVMMLRKDYEKFLLIYKEEQSPGYFLQTYETDKEYINLFAKLRKDNTIFMEEVTKDRDIHHGVYIDIFPLDSIPDTKLERCIHRSILVFLDLFRLSSEMQIVRASSSGARKLVGRILHPLARRVVDSRYIRVIDSLAKAHMERNTIMVSNLYGDTIRWYDRPRQAQPRETFDSCVYLRFEDGNFPAPRDWHQYLTAVYGDYMVPPPIEHRHPQHGIIKINLGA